MPYAWNTLYIYTNLYPHTHAHTHTRTHARMHTHTHTQHTHTHTHNTHTHTTQYGFVFRILTKGRDYVFNAVSHAKRVCALCLFMLREGPPWLSLFTGILCLVAFDFQTPHPLSPPPFVKKGLGNDILTVQF